MDDALRPGWAQGSEGDETAQLRTLKPRLRRADLAIARIPPKSADPYYATPEWRALRTACLDRDGWRCVICGAPATVADHIISRKAGGRDELANLRSLCRLHDNRYRETPTGERRGDPPARRDGGQER